MNKPIINFSLDGKQYRLLGRVKFELERGYTEPTEEHYNVLQVRNKYFFFHVWQDSEIEHIPNFAWIEAATLGYTSWKSPLIAKYQKLGLCVFDE